MKFLARALMMCLAATSLVAQSYADKATELPKLQRFSAGQVDKSIDPCVDFYQYTCNSFFKANPIPGDQVVWGTSSPLQLWNETLLRETLEAAAKKEEGRSRSPIAQKIGDYWAACMDESARNKTATAEIKPEFDRINAIKNKSQMVDVIARIHSIFNGSWIPDDNQSPTAVFGFTATQDYDDATKIIAGFDQAGMNLPGREFYLQDDARSKELRDKYVVHIANMLKLGGEPEAQASQNAKTILAMETEMANAAMDNVKRRDPKNLNNKMTLAQLQALTPSLDFKRYLALVKAPPTQTYLVSSPDFFRGLEQIIQKHPVEHWKAYLRWTMTQYASPTLSDPFDKESWDFYSKTLVGAKEMQPRWRRCVRAADRDLGEALGQAYVERAFPPENKKQTSELVKAVENALEQDTDQLQWMTSATKVKTKEKLHLILDKIGYPDHWKDYSSVKITPDSYFANVAAANTFEFNRWLNKIGKPVDRYEWTMTPPTINAYYDPQMNTINFPGGILQPPFYDAQQDPAVNYGAVGSVMGHEITHGFDDQGRKFDGKGNLRDWWTLEDAKAYDERGKCISDQYTVDLPEYGVKTNGLLTQGEDTADNGGIYLALIALENTLRAKGKTLDSQGEDGLSSLQRFFLGFANNWCTQYRPEVARLVILSDPHSIPKIRVNNTVANMPEFAKAFGCKKGQPEARENACRMW